MLQRGHIKWVLHIAHRPSDHHVSWGWGNQHGFLGAELWVQCPTVKFVSPELFLDGIQQRKGAPPERHNTSFNAGIMTAEAGCDDPLVVPNPA